MISPGLRSVRTFRSRSGPQPGAADRQEGEEQEHEDDVHHRDGRLEEVVDVVRDELADLVDEEAEADPPTKAAAIRPRPTDKAGAARASKDAAMNDFRQQVQAAYEAPGAPLWRAAANEIKLLLETAKK